MSPLNPQRARHLVSANRDDRSYVVRAILIRMSIFAPLDRFFGHVSIVLSTFRCKIVDPILAYTFLGILTQIFVNIFIGYQPKFLHLLFLGYQTRFSRVHFLGYQPRFSRVHFWDTNPDCRMYIFGAPSQIFASIFFGI